MARSKHTTRRDLLEAARSNFRNSRAWRSRLEKVEEDLRQKRRIKQQVRAERRGEGRSASGSADAAAIPIRVEDAGRYVHFPADPEDLREVLRRLPGGVADGIEAIELALGKEQQKEIVEEDGLDPEVDPFVGRCGVVDLPGVHRGHALGVYYSPRGLIQLYAYVYDPAIENLRIKETYLKLRFLSTLVHEVAHHVDRTTRVARGRWRFDSKEKIEIYAESSQCDWVREAVIPYLRECHAERVAELEDWIESRTRVRIPFEQLGGDPRITVKGGFTRFITPISECFEDLLEDAESGADARTIRRNLAINVHYGGHYELALEIVEALIREDAGDLESLTARADFLQHLGRYEEAGNILRDVLSANPDLREAWRVQSLVAQDTKNWAGALEATANLLRLSERRLPWIVALQARTLLELGRFEEMGERVAEMKEPRSPRYTLAQAVGFEAMALLRSGRLEEALAAAEKGLDIAAGTAWRPELLAVRFEALCRLGRQREATPLDEETLGWLERRGYEDWARRLSSAGNLR